jgi:nucleotide-binding universal stress UspA family protein
MTTPPGRQVHQGRQYPAVEREAPEEAPAERDDDVDREDGIQGALRGTATPHRVRGWQGVAFGKGRGTRPLPGVVEVPRVLALARASNADIVVDGASSRNSLRLPSRDV